MPRFWNGNTTIESRGGGSDAKPAVRHLPAQQRSYGKARRQRGSHRPEKRTAARAKVWSRLAAATAGSWPFVSIGAAGGGATLSTDGRNRYPRPMTVWIQLLLCVPCPAPCAGWRSAPSDWPLRRSCRATRPASGPVSSPVRRNFRPGLPDVHARKPSAARPCPIRSGGRGRCDRAERINLKPGCARSHRRCLTDRPLRPWFRSRLMVAWAVLHHRTDLDGIWTNLGPSPPQRIVPAASSLPVFRHDAC